MEEISREISGALARMSPAEAATWGDALTSAASAIERERPSDGFSVKYGAGGKFEAAASASEERKPADREPGSATASISIELDAEGRLISLSSSAGGSAISFGRSGSGVASRISLGIRGDGSISSVGASSSGPWKKSGTSGLSGGMSGSGGFSYGAGAPARRGSARRNIDIGEFTSGSSVCVAVTLEPSSSKRKANLASTTLGLAGDTDRNRRLWSRSVELYEIAHCRRSELSLDLDSRRREAELAGETIEAFMMDSREEIAADAASAVELLREAEAASPDELQAAIAFVRAKARGRLAAMAGWGGLKHNSYSALNAVIDGELWRRPDGSRAVGDELALELDDGERLGALSVAIDESSRAAWRLGVGAAMRTLADSMFEQDSPLDDAEFRNIAGALEDACRLGSIVPAYAGKDGCSAGIFGGAAGSGTSTAREREGGEHGNGN